MAAVAQSTNSFTLSASCKRVADQRCSILFCIAAITSYAEKYIKSSKAAWSCEL